ncbi:MAG: DUF1109 family protein [Bdellovibrionales bacterium]|nr:DUF1109 family protein [Bdellovibrionales bacterium]
MPKSKDTFISELVESYKPTGRLWPSKVRAAVGFIGILAAQILMLFLVQPFRAMWWEDMLRHPHLGVEVVAGLALSLLSFLYLFRSAVPGETGGSWLRLLSGVALGAFLAALYFGLSSDTPTTAEGARRGCEFEVIFYALLAWPWLAFFLYRGLVQDWKRAGAVAALAAGLISSSLMQLACMYNPWHAFFFHYLPLVVLMLVGIAAGSAARGFVENRNKSVK